MAKPNGFATSLLQLLPDAYLLKLACTDVLVLTLTMQVGVVPEQLPPQPRKVLPAGGVAVKVTTLPDTNFAEQVLPQLIPARSLVMVPGLLRPTDNV